MSESYTLSAIELATGIPYEKLRYVIDQRLLPGDHHARHVFEAGSQGRGTPRVYGDLSAFGIACAALLLRAGLRKATVLKVMDRVCKYTGETREISSIPIVQAFAERDTAFLEVGDGVNVRFHGSEDYLRKKLDTGWQQVETGAVLSDYEPMVVVSVNAAKLRRCFKG